MTPRERALAAMRGQTPDRPPIFDLLVDPKLLAEATPDGTYESFAREFQFDGKPPTLPERKKLSSPFQYAASCLHFSPRSSGGCRAKCPIGWRRSDKLSITWSPPVNA